MSSGFVPLRTGVVRKPTRINKKATLLIRPHVPTRYGNTKPFYPRNVSSGRFAVGRTLSGPRKVASLGFSRRFDIVGGAAIANMLVWRLRMICHLGKDPMILSLQFSSIAA